MKIIITGASGFVGNLVVSELKKKEIKLLLVGRSLNKLKNMYPDNEICEYDNLIKYAKNYDCIIHLATFNNVKIQNYNVARKENLNIFKKVFEIAISSKLDFFNFSSLHSLDSNKKTYYAESKREIEKIIENLNYSKVSTLYLPLIYGDKKSGKLKFLNVLPHFLSNFFFYFLSALKPTIHVNTILNHLFGINFKSNKLYFNILTENISSNLVFTFCKRMFDLTISLSILISLWWLFIFIWVFIKLETSGPGVILQKRVGKNGKLFNCIKFRTMKVGVKQAPTHEMTLDDLTTIGGYLRKTKLDELPQIFNIIFNDMSLVGPRPCLEIQHELIAKRKKFQILDIKPGITGFAQINKVDMSNIDKITKYDFIYLKTQSIINDLDIVIKTVFGAGNIDNIKI